jgi:hypothetical protein
MGFQMNNKWNKWLDAMVYFCEKEGTSQDVVRSLSKSHRIHDIRSNWSKIGQPIARMTYDFIHAPMRLVENHE